MKMLEKIKIQSGSLKTVALRRNHGFTAVEIAMVAAVIAILSLIVLPIFRNRVEDAKIAAAQADLRALMLAEQVVKADTDVYARLEDLDNVALFGYTTAPPLGVDKEVPFFKYIDPATLSVPANTRRVMADDAERSRFAGNEESPVWRGPYIAFQRSISYADLKLANISTYLLTSNNSNNYQAAIQDRTFAGFRDHDDARYPIDPWGNPYMFFPPTGNGADPTPAGLPEFPSSVIYSLGPNGQPGDGAQAANIAAYTREYAAQNAGQPFVLGKDDDLMVEF